jgi:hypothetical protein
VLWLAGSRFSRSLVTLLAVSVGAVVGMHLPGWMGWSVDPMGVAFCGALALGLSGYLLHTTWIGVALSAVLALWVGTAAWLTVGGGQQVQWPAVTVSADLAKTLGEVWRALPGDLPRVIPVAITVLSPKLGRVLTYSLVGLSMLVVMGATALRMSRPDWLGMLPRSGAMQMGVMLGLVAVGVMMQWRLTPVRFGGGSGCGKGRDAKE